MKQSVFICLFLCAATAPLHAAFSNGSLDTTFNPTPPGTFPGVPGAESLAPATTYFGAGAFGAGAAAFALAIQSDGKIIAVGLSTPDDAFPAGSYITKKTMAAVRLNTDGSLDSSFTGAGTTYSVQAGVESIFYNKIGRAHV